MDSFFGTGILASIKIVKYISWINHNQVLFYQKSRDNYQQKKAEDVALFYTGYSSWFPVISSPFN